MWLPDFSCYGYNPQDLTVRGWILQRVFFLWSSIKEELFPSTLVSLAPELIRRRNAVSFQSLPTCTAHCWQVAPGLCSQQRTKRKKMGQLGFLKTDDLSGPSTQEEKQNGRGKISAWREKNTLRLGPAEGKRVGSCTGLKVGAMKTCMLSRELPELHKRGSKEKGRAEAYFTASSLTLSCPTSKQTVFPLARSTKSSSMVVRGDFFQPLQPCNGNFHKAVSLWSFQPTCSTLNKLS